jgi:hypothetical protein
MAIANDADARVLARNSYQLRQPTRRDKRIVVKKTQVLASRERSA